MSDFELAEAIDALLWIGPSGNMRDNGANLKAVSWSLEERRRAIELLRELLRSLLPLQLWREYGQLAMPLLETLLFVQEQAGGEDLAGRSEQPE